MDFNKRDLTSSVVFTTKLNRAKVKPIKTSTKTVSGSSHILSFGFNYTYLPGSESMVFLNSATSFTLYLPKSDTDDFNYVKTGFQYIVVTNTGTSAITLTVNTQESTTQILSKQTTFTLASGKSLELCIIAQHPTASAGYMMTYTLY